MYTFGILQTHILDIMLISSQGIQVMLYEVNIYCVTINNKDGKSKEFRQLLIKML